MSGEVTDFAGTGESGSTNGGFDEAQFNGPNGIATNESETKMYVTEYGVARVRLLDLLVTSIAENVHDDVQLFPNPAVDKLFINLDSNPIQRILVMDVYGSVQQNILRSNGYIDVSGLATGFYLVRLETIEGMFVKQFVKL